MKSKFSIWWIISAKFSSLILKLLLPPHPPIIHVSISFILCLVINKKCSQIKYYCILECHGRKAIIIIIILINIFDIKWNENGMAYLKLKQKTLIIWSKTILWTNIEVLIQKLFILKWFQVFFKTAAWDGLWFMIVFPFSLFSIIILKNFYLPTFSNTFITIMSKEKLIHVALWCINWDYSNEDLIAPYQQTISKFLKFKTCQR